jgi:sugar (glycoside-pentoside-hexuronide) transporter
VSAEPAAAPPPASLRRENLSRATVLGYGAGNFAFALLGLVVSVNLQFFYTDYVGLSAGLVSWSLLLARLVDAFIDPLMGYWSDRTRTRIGRRRPYILAASIPLGVAFYLLFTPPVVEDPAQHQGTLLLYMLSLYFLTYFLWTVGAVPYYSLGAELSDDYDERTRVIAVREAFALAGLLLATFVPAFLIHLYGGRVGYSFMGGVLGFGTALFLFVSGAATRERAEFQGRAPMNPYAGWAATVANPHFRPLLVAFALAAIAGAVPATLVIYVSVYVIGTPEWWTASVPGWMPTWSYYLLVYFGAGVVSLPLWLRAARRTSKRASWAFGIALAFLSSALCWWLEEGDVGFFTAILVLGGVGFGNFLAIPPSMVADVIDYDEVHTGGRREASYFAIWAFVAKCGNAITGFAALQVLERVGYVPGAPQTATVKLWMIWMFSVFPALFYLLCAIALARFRFSRADLDAAQRAVGRAAVTAP